jgi:trimethylamine:corrinoid methyltransferase-like protein
MTQSLKVDYTSICQCLTTIHVTSSCMICTQCPQSWNFSLTWNLHCLSYTHCNYHKLVYSAGRL